MKKFHNIEHFWQSFPWLRRFFPASSEKGVGPHILKLGLPLEPQESPLVDQGGDTITLCIEQDHIYLSIFYQSSNH